MERDRGMRRADFTFLKVPLKSFSTWGAFFSTGPPATQISRTGMERDRGIGSFTSSRFRMSRSASVRPT